jgi:hypothetical protein
MIAMPAKAAAVAPRVHMLSRSPRISQAIAAVTKGMAAIDHHDVGHTGEPHRIQEAHCRNRRADRDQHALDARGMDSPATAGRAAAAPTTTARNAPPNRPRQNSRVQASTWISRVKKPGRRVGRGGGGPTMMYRARPCSSHQRHAVELDVERAEPSRRGRRTFAPAYASAKYSA